MLVYNQINKSQWPQLAQRTRLEKLELKDFIAEVFAEVQRDGDGAVRNYANKYDKIVADDFSYTLNPQV